MSCSAWLSGARAIAVILLSFLVAILQKIVSFCLCSFAAQFCNKKTKCGNRKPRLAVIGGGIAGTAAAWSATKSRAFDSVTLFEPRPTLGGNAKTYEWTTQEDAAPKVRTGLSVLAWPPAYFRHYELLLKSLELPTVDVVPKFYVSEDGQSPVFRQGRDHPEWAKDQQGWDRAVRCIRAVNRFCFFVDPFARVSQLLRFLRGPTWRRPSAAAPLQQQVVSMYEVTFWNPLNVIPARWLCKHVFGVSDAFWEKVIVPVYSSSFLTARLDGLPAVILPPLDDIISVGNGDPLKTLHTWRGSSKDVFDGMSKELAEVDVLLDTDVQWVVKDSETNLFSVSYTAKSETSRHCLQRRRADPSKRPFFMIDTSISNDDTAVEWFDVVIFACPATAVDALTKSAPADKRVCKRNALRDALFESIVPMIRYENERDDNFVYGTVHSDTSLAIPNEAMRHELLSERYTNYIELHRRSTDASREPTLSLENTFVLGTWVPEALRAAEAIQNTKPATKRKSQPLSASLFNKQHNVLDLMVTYNAKGEERCSRLKEQQRMIVDNSWAHPQFTMQSLGLSMCMPLLQGRHGAYYCASYTTPGNGHDLSLLSALVVVDEAVKRFASSNGEGYYPFEQTEATTDFALLQKMMIF